MKWVIFLIVELILMLWQVQIPGGQVRLGFSKHLNVTHKDSDSACAYKIFHKWKSPKLNSHKGKTEL